MRRIRRPLGFTVLFLCAGCAGSESIPEPSAPTGQGEIEVLVYRDAYRDQSFRVDVDGTVFFVPLSGLVLEDLPARVHEARLLEVPDDCVLRGTDVVNVLVVANDRSYAEFAIACTGMIRVETRTVGTDRDPTGYRVIVADSIEADLDIDDTGEWDRLRKGEYPVVLTDVASNCEVTDGISRIVNVVPADTVDVFFDVNCITPTLPPPTGRIVFHSGTFANVETDIYVHDFSTGVRTRLMSDETVDVEPAASGVSDRIVFARHSVERNLMAVNPDGTNLEQIGAVSDVYDPDWSPDGERIVYSSGYPFATSDEADLWIVNADGSGLTNLTNTTEMREVDPTWSPDGSRIVYATAAPFEEMDLWIVDADGSNPELLVEYAETPAWSPDGTEIAFSRAQEVYILTLADGTERRLTYSGGYSPTWSPDGLWIAYTAGGGAEGSAIHYVNAGDGTGRVTLTGDISYSDDAGWW